MRNLIRFIRIFFAFRKKASVNRNGDCPVCGCDWNEHDFGVPHPYCPSSPLPGKSWYTQQRKENK